MKEYMNNIELAEYLGVDENTVKNFFPAPPSFKLGEFEKYKRSDVDRWVDELNNEQAEQKMIIAETNLEKAKIKLREKEYEEASKLARESILQNPKAPDAHFIYGIILVKLEKWADGEFELRKAYKLNPKADWRDEATYQISLCQKSLGTYYAKE